MSLGAIGGGRVEAIGRSNFLSPSWALRERESNGDPEKSPILFPGEKNAKNSSGLALAGFARQWRPRGDDLADENRAQHLGRLPRRTLLAKASGARLAGRTHFPVHQRTCSIDTHTEEAVSAQSHDRKRAAVRVWEVGPEGFQKRSKGTAAAQREDGECSRGKHRSDPGTWYQRHPEEHTDKQEAHTGEHPEPREAVKAQLHESDFACSVRTSGEE